MKQRHDMYTSARVLISIFPPTSLFHFLREDVKKLLLGKIYCPLMIFPSPLHRSQPVQGDSFNFPFFCVKLYVTMVSGSTGWFSFYVFPKLNAQFLLQISPIYFTSYHFSHILSEMKNLVE